MNGGSPGPLLGIGTVRHERVRPRAHRFSYPTYFMLLPLRALRSVPAKDLARNRSGLVSFHDRDHGDGRDDCLAWMEELLQSEGIAADGEIWLQCYPRVLGYVFKPVSFWFCHRSDGSLAAVVAEVNNTFGERHCYLLAGAGLAFGREQVASKVFHVSPFFGMEGHYRFCFMRTSQAGNNERIVARVDYGDDHGPLLLTSISGRLAPLTAARIRSAFFGMPLMTLGVIARIHWQALKLWRKRVPFLRKPPPPEHFVTR